MAKQTLNNGEQGLSFRTKLNDMFTELYNSIASLGTTISGLVSSNTSILTTLGDHSTTLANQDIINTNVNDSLIFGADSITALNGRVTFLEATGILTVNALSSLAPATITTTPTKLAYFSSEGLSHGGFVTADIPNQTITVNTSGIYSVYGEITAEFATNETMVVNLYKNGLLFSPGFTIQGLGASKPVGFGYHMVVELVATDVLTLFVTSTTGTFTATIISSGVNFEKKPF